MEWQLLSHTGSQLHKSKRSRDLQRYILTREAGHSAFATWYEHHELQLPLLVFVNTPPLLGFQRVKLTRKLSLFVGSEWSRAADVSECCNRKEHLHLLIVR